MSLLKSFIKTHKSSAFPFSDSPKAQPRSSFHPALRIFSLALALIFTWDTVAGAAPALPQQARPADLAWLSEINLPSALGSVADIFVPQAAAPSAPVILHIQDAHAHPEAQRNIQGILEHFARAGRIKKIAAEAAFSPIAAGIYQFLPITEANQKVWSHLAEQGELTGAEMFLLNSGKPAAKLAGVDDPALYEKSFRLFYRLKSSAPEIQARLAVWRRALEVYETRILDEELRGLLRARRAWDSRQDAGLDYFHRLKEASARELGLDLSHARHQFEWPNLTRLMKSQEEEGRIAPEKVRAEAGQLAGRLAAEIKDSAALHFFTEGLQRLMPDAQTAGSFAAWAAAQTGFSEIRTVRRFWEELHRRTETQNISFIDYPALLAFSGLRILQEEIQPQDLLNEMKKLEDRLFAKMARRAGEKELIALEKDFALLERLFALELVREEYGIYQKRRAQLTGKALAGRFAQLGKEGAGLPAIPPAMQRRAEDFYRFANLRDEKLVENTLRLAGDQSAALVTGGFHSEGITALLREKNIPYAVIVPRMTSFEDSDLYKKVMLGTHAETLGARLLGETAAPLTRIPAIEKRRRGVPLAAILKTGAPVLEKAGRDTARDLQNLAQTHPLFRGLSISFRRENSGWKAVRSEVRTAQPQSSASNFLDRFIDAIQQEVAKRRTAPTETPAPRTSSVIPEPHEPGAAYERLREALPPATLEDAGAAARSEVRAAVVIDRNNSTFNKKGFPVKLAIEVGMFGPAISLKFRKSESSKRTLHYEVWMGLGTNVGSISIELDRKKRVIGVEKHWASYGHMMNPDEDEEEYRDEIVDWLERLKGRPFDRDNLLRSEVRSTESAKTWKLRGLAALVIAAAAGLPLGGIYVAFQRQQAAYYAAEPYAELATLNPYSGPFSPARDLQLYAEISPRGEPINPVGRFAPGYRIRYSDGTEVQYDGALKITARRRQARPDEGLVSFWWYQAELPDGRSVWMDSESLTRFDELLAEGTRLVANPANPLQDITIYAQPYLGSTPMARITGDEITYYDGEKKIWDWQNPKPYAGFMEAGRGMLRQHFSGLMQGIPDYSSRWYQVKLRGGETGWVEEIQMQPEDDAAARSEVRTLQQPEENAELKRRVKAFLDEHGGKVPLKDRLDGFNEMQVRVDKILKPYYPTQLIYDSLHGTKYELDNRWIFKLVLEALALDSLGYGFKLTFEHHPEGVRKRYRWGKKDAQESIDESDYEDEQTPAYYVVRLVPQHRSEVRADLERVQSSFEVLQDNFRRWLWKYRTSQYRLNHRRLSQRLKAEGVHWLDRTRYYGIFSSDPVSRESLILQVMAFQQTGQTFNLEVAPHADGHYDIRLLTSRDPDFGPSPEGILERLRRGLFVETGERGNRPYSAIEVDPDKLNRLAAAARKITEKNSHRANLERYQLYVNWDGKTPKLQVGIHNNYAQLETLEQRMRQRLEQGEYLLEKNDVYHFANNHPIRHILGNAALNQADKSEFSGHRAQTLAKDAEMHLSYGAGFEIVVRPAHYEYVPPHFFSSTQGFAASRFARISASYTVVPSILIPTPFRMKKAARSEVRAKAVNSPEEVLPYLLKKAKARAVKVRDSRVARPEIARMAAAAVQTLERIQKDLWAAPELKANFIGYYQTYGLQGSVDAVIDWIQDRSGTVYKNLPPHGRKGLSPERIEMAARRFLRKELEAFMADSRNRENPALESLFRPRLSSILELVQELFLDLVIEEIAADLSLAGFVGGANGITVVGLGLPDMGVDDLEEGGELPPDVRRSEVRALVLSRAAGESIRINDDITVTVAVVLRNRIRLNVQAPSGVPVFLEGQRAGSSEERSFELRRGQALWIGAAIRIELADFRGSKARLSTEAPREVRIQREEIYQAIQREKEQGGDSARSEVRVDAQEVQKIYDILKRFSFPSRSAVLTGLTRIMEAVQLEDYTTAFYRSSEILQKYEADVPKIKNPEARTGAQHFRQLLLKLETAYYESHAPEFTKSIEERLLPLIKAALYAGADAVYQGAPAVSDLRAGKIQIYLRTGKASGSYQFKFMPDPAAVPDAQARSRRSGDIAPGTSSYKLIQALIQREGKIDPDKNYGPAIAGIHAKVVSQTEAPVEAPAAPAAAKPAEIQKPAEVSLPSVGEKLLSGTVNVIAHDAEPKLQSWIQKKAAVPGIEVLVFEIMSGTSLDSLLRATGIARIREFDSAKPASGNFIRSEDLMTWPPLAKGEKIAVALKKRSEVRSAWTQAEENKLLEIADLLLRTRQKLGGESKIFIHNTEEFGFLPDYVDIAHSRFIAKDFYRLRDLLTEIEERHPVTTERTLVVKSDEFRIVERSGLENRQIERTTLELYADEEDEEPVGEAELAFIRPISHTPPPWLRNERLMRMYTLEAWQYPDSPRRDLARALYQYFDRPEKFRRSEVRTEETRDAVQKFLNQFNPANGPVPAEDFRRATGLTPGMAIRSYARLFKRASVTLEDFIPAERRSEVRTSRIEAFDPLHFKIDPSLNFDLGVDEFGLEWGEFALDLEDKSTLKDFQRMLDLIGYRPEKMAFPNDEIPKILVMRDPEGEVRFPGMMFFHFPTQEYRLIDFTNGKLNYHGYFTLIIINRGKAVKINPANYSYFPAGYKFNNEDQNRIIFSVFPPAASGPSVRSEVRAFRLIDGREVNLEIAGFNPDLVKELVDESLLGIWREHKRLQFEIYIERMIEKHRPQMEALVQELRTGDWRIADRLEEYLSYEPLVRTPGKSLEDDIRDLSAGMMARGAKTIRTPYFNMGELGVFLNQAGGNAYLKQFLLFLEKHPDRGFKYRIDTVHNHEAYVVFRAADEIKNYDSSRIVGEKQREEAEFPRLKRQDALYQLIRILKQNGWLIDGHDPATGIQGLDLLELDKSRREIIHLPDSTFSRKVRVAYDILADRSRRLASNDWAENQGRVGYLSALDHARIEKLAADLGMDLSGLPHLPLAVIRSEVRIGPAQPRSPLTPMDIFEGVFFDVVRSMLKVGEKKPDWDQEPVYQVMFEKLDDGGRIRISIPFSMILDDYLRYLEQAADRAGIPHAGIEFHEENTLSDYMVISLLPSPDVFRRLFILALNGPVQNIAETFKQGRVEILDSGRVIGAANFEKSRTEAVNRRSLAETAALEILANLPSGAQVTVTQSGQRVILSRSEVRAEFAELAEQAFSRGQLSEAALNNIRSWTGEAYARVHKQLNDEFERAGNDRDQWQAIDDAWYTVLAPGTAGMRGKRGLGTNRINEYTLGQFLLAQALAIADKNYDAIVGAHDASFDPAVQNKAIVIGGDSRVGSYDPDLSRNELQTEKPGWQIKLQALLNIAHGTRAYVYRLPVSTPQISWSTHELKVDPGYRIVSGGMNTASHNPSSDNGNKPYKPDGSQSTGAFAQAIQQKIGAATADYLAGLEYEGILVLERLDEAFARAVEKGDVRWVGGANDPYRADEQFIVRELEETVHADGERFNAERLHLKNVKIVVSPLYGVSRHILAQILKRRGLEDRQIIWVEDIPNPAFPDVRLGKPNPEAPEAREVALRKAVQVNADLVLWTDPDADRPAVAAKIDRSRRAEKPEDYISFNGNQQLALLTDYLIREIRNLAQIPAPPGAGVSSYEDQADAIAQKMKRTLVASTAVSGDLMKVIARDAGADVVETLTGFKYIGDLVESRSKVIQKAERISEAEWQKLSKSRKIELALQHSQYFLFGGEESLGSLSSDAPHDKDAIAGVMWFVEILGRLNAQQTGLKERLEEIYRKYGYFAERFPMLIKGRRYAGEWFSEAQAMQIIKAQDGSSILNTFRNPVTSPRTIGGKRVIAVLDYDAQTAKTPGGELLFDAGSHAGLITPKTAGIPASFQEALKQIPVPKNSGLWTPRRYRLQGIYSFAHKSFHGSKDRTVLPRENFIMLLMDDGSKIIARPSGTEPVIKFYINARGLYENRAAVDQWIESAAAELETIADDAARRRFPEKFAKSEVRQWVQRVLIVDDEAYYLREKREAVTQWAEQKGYSSLTIDEAQDGAPALRMFKEALDRGEPYDLVITDQVMNLMDGIDFAREMDAELKRRTGAVKVPVLMISAAGRGRFRNALANGVLTDYAGKHDGFPGAAEALDRIENKIIAARRPAPLTGADFAALDKMDTARLSVPGVHNLAGVKDAAEKLAALAKINPAGILIRSKSEINQKFIEDLRAAVEAQGQTLRLKHIIRLGHGLDNVDTVYAQSQGMEVYGTKGSAPSVAALALRMMAAAERKSRKASLTGKDEAPADIFLPLESFKAAADEKIKVQPAAEQDALRAKAVETLEPISAETLQRLSGRVVGVIGAGNIASEFITRARAIGMTVWVNSRSMENKTAERPDEPNYRYADKETIYQYADHVVLLTGLNDATLGMIGESAVDLMINNPDLKGLINPDRRKVVDETQALRLLQKNPHAYYFVDEIPASADLRAHEKTFYVDHIGGSTAEAENNIRSIVDRQLQALIAASQAPPTLRSEVREETSRRPALEKGWVIANHILVAFHSAFISSVLSIPEGMHSKENILTFLFLSAETAVSLLFWYLTYHIAIWWHERGHYWQAVSQRTLREDLLDEAWDIREKGGWARVKHEARMLLLSSWGKFPGIQRVGLGYQVESPFNLSVAAAGPRASGQLAWTMLPIAGAFVFIGLLGGLEILVYLGRLAFGLGAVGLLDRLMADPGKYREFQEQERKAREGREAAGQAPAGSWMERMPDVFYHMYHNRPLSSGDVSVPWGYRNSAMGGRHTEKEYPESNISLQEGMFIPLSAKTVEDAQEMTVALQNRLKAIIESSKGSRVMGIGLEGGLAPYVTPETGEVPELRMWRMMKQAIEDLGYVAGRDVVIGLDAAASELEIAYREEFDQPDAVGQYLFWRDKNKIVMSRDQLLGLYRSAMEEGIPIISIEDPFSEDDKLGWEQIMREFNPAFNWRDPSTFDKGSLFVVGDDLVTTKDESIEEAADKGWINTVLIKPNQIGTLTETTLAILTALGKGLSVISSHRSKKPNDPMEAHVAVSSNAMGLKSGGGSNTERLMVYQELVRILQKIMRLKPDENEEADRLEGELLNQLALLDVMTAENPTNAGIPTVSVNFTAGVPGGRRTWEFSGTTPLGTSAGTGEAIHLVDSMIPPDEITARYEDLFERHPVNNGTHRFKKTVTAEMVQSKKDAALAEIWERSRRYEGKGVENAARYAREVLAQDFLDRTPADIGDLLEIDQRLLDLELEAAHVRGLDLNNPIAAAQRKAVLGMNGILSTSLALARFRGWADGQELWQVLRDQKISTMARTVAEQDQKDWQVLAQDLDFNELVTELQRVAVDLKTRGIPLYTVLRKHLPVYESGNRTRDRGTTARPSRSEVRTAETWAAAGIVAGGAVTAAAFLVRRAVQNRKIRRAENERAYIRKNHEQAAYRIEQAVRQRLMDGGHIFTQHHLQEFRIENLSEEFWHYAGALIREMDETGGKARLSFDLMTVPAPEAELVLFDNPAFTTQTNKGIVPQIKPFLRYAAIRNLRIEGARRSEVRAGLADLKIFVERLVVAMAGSMAAWGIVSAAELAGAPKIALGKFGLMISASGALLGLALYEWLGSVAARHQKAAELRAITEDVRSILWSKADKNTEGFLIAPDPQEPGRFHFMLIRRKAETPLFISGEDLTASQFVIQALLDRPYISNGPITPLILDSRTPEKNDPFSALDLMVAQYLIPVARLEGVSLIGADPNVALFDRWIVVTRDEDSDQRVTAILNESIKAALEKYGKKSEVRVFEASRKPVSELRHVITTPFGHFAIRSLFKSSDLGENFRSQSGTIDVQVDFPSGQGPAGGWLKILTTGTTLDFDALHARVTEMVHDDPAQALRNLQAAYHDKPGVKLSSLNAQRSEVRMKSLGEAAEELRAPAEKLRRIAEVYSDEMNAGLAEPGKSSLLMIPSLVGLPDGTEKGVYGAIDFGGTNLRVLLVRLDGQGGAEIIASEKVTIPESLMGPKSTSEKLFDFIGGRFGAMLTQARGRIADIPENLAVGFTYSYPAQINRRLDSAIAVQLVKKLRVPDLPGKDVGQLLQKSFDKTRSGARVAAVVNDTVGTGVVGAYRFRNVRAGIIMGTGRNAAYPETDSERVTAPGFDGQAMWINTESGRLAVPEEFRTDEDRALDASSPNTGEHIFEKMTAGMYLGELFRLYLISTGIFGAGKPRALTRNSLQEGEGYRLRLKGRSWEMPRWLEPAIERLPENMRKKYFRAAVLTAEDMAQMSADKLTDLSKIEEILQSVGLGGTTVTQRYDIRGLADYIVQRAARLNAMEIMALVRRHDPGLEQEHVIAIDGSLFEKHPRFREWLEKALGDMAVLYAPNTDVKPIRLELVQDGSGLGAGIIAAMASAKSEVRTGGVRIPVSASAQPRTLREVLQARVHVSGRGNPSPLGIVLAHWNEKLADEQIFNASDLDQPLPAGQGILQVTYPANVMARLRGYAEPPSKPLMVPQLPAAAVPAAEPKKTETPSDLVQIQQTAFLQSLRRAIVEGILPFAVTEFEEENYFMKLDPARASVKSQLAYIHRHLKLHILTTEQGHRVGVSPIFSDEEASDAGFDLSGYIKWTEVPKGHPFAPLMPVLLQKLRPEQIAELNAGQGFGPRLERLFYQIEKELSARSEVRAASLTIALEASAAPRTLREVIAGHVLIKGGKIADIVMARWDEGQDDELLLDRTDLDKSMSQAAGSLYVSYPQNVEVELKAPALPQSTGVTGVVDIKRLTLLHEGMIKGILPFLAHALDKTGHFEILSAEASPEQILAYIQKNMIVEVSRIQKPSIPGVKPENGYEISAVPNFAEGPKDPYGFSLRHARRSTFVPLKHASAVVLEVLLGKLSSDQIHELNLNAGFGPRLQKLYEKIESEMKRSEVRSPRPVKAGLPDENSVEAQLRQMEQIVQHYAEQGPADDYAEIEALLTTLYGGSVQFYTVRQRKNRQSGVHQHRYDNLVGLLNLEAWAEKRKPGTHTGKPALSAGQSVRLHRLKEAAKRRLEFLGIRSSLTVTVNGREAVIGQLLSTDPEFQNPFLHTFLGQSEVLGAAAPSLSRVEQAIETGGFSKEEAAYFRRYIDIFEPHLQVSGARPYFLRVHHNNVLGPFKGGINFTFSDTLKNDKVFIARFDALVAAGLNVKELRYFLRKWVREKTLALAFGMTAKSAAAGLPYGGGKGMILFADVFESSRDGKPVLRDHFVGEEADIFRATQIRSYTRNLVEAGKIGAYIDVPAPDAGSRALDMDLMADELLKVVFERAQKTGSVRSWDPVLREAFEAIPNVSLEAALRPLYLTRTVKYLDDLLAQGQPVPEWARPLIEAIATFTSKTVSNLGSLFRDDSTGYGGVLVLEEVVRRSLDLPLDGMVAKVMGFGGVGIPAIKQLIRKGVKIRAISEGALGIVYKPGDGFTLEDIEKLEKLKLRTHGFTHLNDSEEFVIPGASLITEAEFFARTAKEKSAGAPREILVLAAKENAVDHQTQADIFLELANGGISNEIYETLIKSGALVIPDTLANPGGVIVSYFEWVQNLEWLKNPADARWSRDKVRAELEKKLTEAVKRAAEVRDELNTDWRTAVDILMMRRVLSAQRSETHRRKRLQASPSVEPAKFKKRSEVRQHVQSHGRAWPQVLWVAQAVSYTFVDPMLVMPAHVPVWNLILFGSGAADSGNDGEVAKLARAAERAADPRVVVLVSPEDDSLPLGESELSAMGLASGSRVVVINRRGSASELWNRISPLKLGAGIRAERVLTQSDYPTVQELQGIFERYAGHVPVLILPAGRDALLAQYQNAASRDGFAVTLPRSAEARSAFTYLVGRNLPATLIRDVPSDDLLKIQVRSGALSPAWVPVWAENRFTAWASSMLRREQAFSQSA